MKRMNRMVPLLCTMGVASSGALLLFVRLRVCGGNLHCAGSLAVSHDTSSAQHGEAAGGSGAASIDANGPLALSSPSRSIVIPPFSGGTTGVGVNAALTLPSHASLALSSSTSGSKTSAAQEQTGSCDEDGHESRAFRVLSSNIWYDGNDHDGTKMVAKVLEDSLVRGPGPKKFNAVQHFKHRRKSLTRFIEREVLGRQLDIFLLQEFFDVHKLVDGPGNIVRLLKGLLGERYEFTHGTHPMTWELAVAFRKSQFELVKSLSTPRKKLPVKGLITVLRVIEKENSGIYTTATGSKCRKSRGSSGDSDSITSNEESHPDSGVAGSSGSTGAKEKKTQERNRYIVAVSVHLPWMGDARETRDGVSQRRAIFKAILGDVLEEVRELENGSSSSSNPDAGSIPASTARASIRSSTTKAAKPLVGVIVGGDLNDPFHPADVAYPMGFRDVFFDLGQISPPTYPGFHNPERFGYPFGERGMLLYDWIFVNAALRSRQAAVLEVAHPDIADGMPYSDHKPVFSEIEFVGQGGAVGQ